MRARRTFLFLDGFKHTFSLKNTDLYRDDGITVLPNSFGFKVEKLNKQTQSIFESVGLQVTVESQKVITNSLDVKLNLNDHSYMPYKKPKANFMYVNKSSRHPKIILKQISNIINERLNNRSSKEENF